jgi:hypothetical protein
VSPNAPRLSADYGIPHVDEGEHSLSGVKLEFRHIRVWMKNLAFDVLVNSSIRVGDTECGTRRLLFADSHFSFMQS